LVEFRRTTTWWFDRWQHRGVAGKQSESAQYDLSGDTQEVRDDLDFLLEERAIDHVWNGESVSVEASRSEEVEGLLTYLHEQPAPEPSPLPGAPSAASGLPAASSNWSGLSVVDSEPETPAVKGRAEALLIVTSGIAGVIYVAAFIPIWFSNWFDNARPPGWFIPVVAVPAVIGGTCLVLFVVRRHRRDPAWPSYWSSTFSFSRAARRRAHLVRSFVEGIRVLRSHASKPGGPAPPEAIQRKESGPR
jgi:hypothetical protein